MTHKCTKTDPLQESINACESERAWGNLRESERPREPKPEVIEDVAPWNEHAEATLAITQVLMARDGLKTHARQRGEAVLASQQQERVQKVARVAKRQRLEDGFSSKVGRSSRR